jgi:hypothetical protein
VINFQQINGGFGGYKIATSVHDIKLALGYAK